MPSSSKLCAISFLSRFSGLNLDSIIYKISHFILRVSCPSNLWTLSSFRGVSLVSILYPFGVSCHFSSSRFFSLRDRTILVSAFMKSLIILFFSALSFSLLSFSRSLASKDPLIPLSPLNFIIRSTVAPNSGFNFSLFFSGNVLLGDALYSSSSKQIYIFVK